MTKINVVFDASTILAWYRKEEGSEKIERLLRDTSISRWIHAVNLAELRYRFLMLTGNEEITDKAIEKIRGFGVVFLFECDSTVIDLASQYREKIKSKRLRISLGDCFGMAATHLKKKDGRVQFVTTDEGEFDSAQKAGLLPVKVDIIHQPSKRPPPPPDEPRPKRKGREK
jgi:PIN domain nuclease of toxin-antitoxin system